MRAPYTHASHELIAEVLGCSRQTVWERCTRLGYPSTATRDGIQLTPIESFEKVYGREFSDAQICEALKTIPRGAARL